MAGLAIAKVRGAGVRIANGAERREGAMATTKARVLVEHVGFENKDTKSPATGNAHVS